MSSAFRTVVAVFLVFVGARPLWGVSVTSFSPTLGSAGDQVTIYGSGFPTSNPQNLVVKFNNVQDTTAQSTAADGTIIMARVPAGAPLGSGPISVQVNGGTAAMSAQDFTVIGPGPYVTNFSPYVGSASTLVTIQGVHFTTATNAYFAGVVGTSFFVQSENQLQVRAPSGVVSGPISVKSAQGTFVSSNFYVAPTLTGFSPATGRANTNVTLTGMNLLGATDVLFNGVSGIVGPATNNSSLKVTVPVGASTGPVRVQTPAGSFTTTSNFVVPPTIFGFSPGAGPIGSSVTITGANFNVGTPVVRFHGVASTGVTGVSFGQLTAVIPAGATTGPISITTTDGSYTNSSTFYLPASITSFTPTNSAPGSTVTITGQNLLGTTNVSFNGTATTFTPPVNNTNLQAIVPANVTTGPISVSTPAGTTNSASLFYAVPIITVFAPTHGLPGTNVTITGLNLLGATMVKFNNVLASSGPATNNTSIQAVVPTNAQTGPITVTTPAGTTMSTNSFVLDYNSDVAVSLTAAPDTVFVGSNLVYTIVVTNNGPLAAPNVSLTNTLPSSVSLKSASATQGTLMTNGNPILGSFPTVATGGSVTVTLTVTPQSTGAITNKASIGSGYSDPAPANNTASITTTVLPLPLLSVGLLSENVVRLSWPVQLTNFVLEYKPNLSSGTMWSSVTTTPSISGNERVVLETNAVAAKFYRLRK